MNGDWFYQIILKQVRFKKNVKGGYKKSQKVIRISHSTTYNIKYTNTKKTS